jgi:hypothetical protein
MYRTKSETPSINNARTDTQIVFREHITQQTGHTGMYVFTFSAHQACQTS